MKTRTNIIVVLSTVMLFAGINSAYGQYACSENQAVVCGSECSNPSL